MRKALIFRLVVEIVALCIIIGTMIIFGVDWDRWDIRAIFVTIPWILFLFLRDIYALWIGDYSSVSVEKEVPPTITRENAAMYLREGNQVTNDIIPDYDPGSTSPQKTD